jgi:hypothetical protein
MTSPITRNVIMSKVYNEHDHTHVVVHHPDRKDTSNIAYHAWRGTFPILLHTGNHVWIVGSYSHEGHSDVKRVGTEFDKGYDEHGNCILVVPAEWCHYFTEKEAKTIEHMIDADDRWLRYAR